MRKIAILLIIFTLCSFCYAQKVTRFNGSESSAEDTANFLIDNKVVVEVEYDDKSETLRLKYLDGRWGMAFGSGSWFVITKNRLEIMSDHDFIRKFYTTKENSHNADWIETKNIFGLEETNKSEFRRSNPAEMIEEVVEELNAEYSSSLNSEDLIYYYDYIPPTEDYNPKQQ